MSLRSNIIWQYGLQIAKYIFPFITIPYLTRVLGPDVYAVRAYILAVMTFAQVLVDYGFNAYGTRKIAEAKRNLQDESRETSIVMTLRLVICFVGLLLMLLLSLFIPIMANNFTYTMLAYAAVCLKGMLPDFVFQGQEDMGIITRRYVGSQAVAILCIFLFVNSPNDLLLVAVFELLAALLAFVWSWLNVLVVRKIRLIRVSTRGLLSAFSTSTIFFLSNASTTAFTALTTLMIGLLIDDMAQIAYWSVAMTAIQAIQSLYSPVSNSLYPRVCVTHDATVVKPFLKVGIPIVLLGTIAFALLGDVVMLVLGGEEYLPGSYIIPLVSPVLFFSFVGILIGFPILGAFGKEKQLTGSSVTAAIFHIACLFLLAFSGNFTIVNVGILRCITELVMASIRVFFVVKLVKKGGEE